uniref:Uncharacterized protein n=1 Tax=Cucumis melo TaxID=3656 RepID=A0A9I9ED08_CUCME
MFIYEAMKGSTTTKTMGVLGGSHYIIELVEIEFRVPNRLPSSAEAPLSIDNWQVHHIKVLSRVDRYRNSRHLLDTLITRPLCTGQSPRR